jgi:2-polyprenyl-3-methyl-5-hydroxy-6-metoxy-1,4-benzoquinol methylase
MRAAGADVRNVEGMVFDPVAGNFKRSTRDLDVNYFMTAVKNA